MRHRNAGFKLGRNTSHRRALLRNLVTSVLVEDRVETTVAKAKAVRPHVEKMITLGKKGDLHSRRQALSFLQTDTAVSRLFETVAPRYGDRQGGYLRIVRTGSEAVSIAKRSWGATRTTLGTWTRNWSALPATDAQATSAARRGRSAPPKAIKVAIIAAFHAIGAV